MFYTFPVINHIDEVLEAIEGREEFVVKHDADNGIKIINYLVNFEDTFPQVTDRRTAILRECRGITFCDKTGKVISRKYHKFFNLGERPETLVHAVDFTKPHRFLEKLDGSMITPLFINGKLRWATKMGLTDVAKPVDEFTADKIEYHEFCKYWWDSGYTPIFEWCSRKQRIVIDYPEDRLVLTAIRHNVTGEYHTYYDLVDEANAYGIPVVKAGPSCDTLDQDFIEEIRLLEDEEGRIVRFADSGHMLKIKGSWYSQLHKTLEHLTLEKDVIRLIIEEKLDDAKPFLPEDLVSKVDDFAALIFKSAADLGTRLYWEAQASYDNFNGSKKRFATELVTLPENKINSKFLFAAWDHLADGPEYMIKHVLDHIGQHTNSAGKVDQVRYIWGGKSWYDYRDKPLEE